MSKYATVPAALCLLVGLMTPAAPQAPFKLRIASVNSPPSMHTLYMRVAHEEGIYKRNGLDVDDIISLTSGPLMTQALERKTLEFVLSTAEYEDVPLDAKPAAQAVIHA